MDYISSKETLLRWSISERRIQKLCEEGLINGVVRFSKVWAIPKDTIAACRRHIVGFKSDGTVTSWQSFPQFYDRNTTILFVCIRIRASQSHSMISLPSGCTKRRKRS